MIWYHVIARIPVIGLAGRDGESADTVAENLRTQIIKGLTEMSLEKFKKMCEIRELKEDPFKKVVFTKELQKRLGLQELIDDFGGDPF